MALIQPYSDPSKAPGSRVSSRFWRQPVYELSDGTHFCPGASGNTYSDSAWDYVTVGSFKTPGVAEVHPRKTKDVDRKKQPGSQNERLTVLGHKAADVDIRVRVWTPEQLRQFLIFWTAVYLNPAASTVGANTVAVTSGTLGGVGALGSAVALGAGSVLNQTGNANPVKLAWDAYHPSFEEHGITALIFHDGEGFTIDKDGSGYFMIRAVQYASPGKSNVTQTPKGVEPLGSKLDPGAVPTSAAGYALPGSNTSNLAPR
jgi:hypothetical protein